MRQYQKLTEPAKEGVEEPAYMAGDAKVGDSVYRGAFSYIGKGSTIGDKVQLYPHVYVGDDVYHWWTIP